MTVKAPVGDGNELRIYALDGSGNFDTLLYTFDKNVSSSLVGHPKKESLIIDLDSKADDSDLADFFNLYLHNTAVEKQDIEYTDSSKDTLISGVSALVADNKDFGYVWHGAGVLDGATTKIKIAVGHGILSGDTGNASYQPKTVGSYPIQITTISGTQVVCPTSKINAAKATVSSAITIGAAEYGHINFYAVP